MTDEDCLDFSDGRADGDDEDLVLEALVVRGLVVVDPDELVLVAEHALVYRGLERTSLSPLRSEYGV